MNAILDATVESFEQFVRAASFMEPIVVVFHASWCAPCQAMKPILERLAESLKFRLVRVDVGRHGAIALQTSVRSVPTVQVYKNGHAVTVMVGGATEEKLRKFLISAGVTQGALDV